MARSNVSIIIVNYNGKGFVEQSLKSLLKTDYVDFEIILVDNGSSDGSIEDVERTFGSDSRLRIIKKSENLGFAKGSNLGARHASGDYLVFLNHDTLVDKGWLHELVRVMESYPDIGAAQSKLVSYDGGYIDSTGDFMDYTGFAFSRDKGNADKGLYSDLEEIFSARGAAMIVRRTLFLDIGGFDETFFMILEDVDLCWRIRLNGWRIGYVPTSVVLHAGSSSISKKGSNLRSFHSQKNRLIMLIKNYDLIKLVKYLPMSLIELILLLLPGSSRIAYNLTPLKDVGVLGRIRALLFVIHKIRLIWCQRVFVQSNLRKVADRHIMAHMLRGSLIFNYFLIWLLCYRRRIPFAYFLYGTLEQQRKVIQNRGISRSFSV